MDEMTKQAMARSIDSFRLPAYTEIPDVGLFLEQVTKYISEYLRSLSTFSVTPSMISNYVKKGIIANPVKKQYGREQIAYLFFVVIAKTVLSLDDIQLLIDLQKQTYPPQVAYDYFCQELRNILCYVFELKDSPDAVGTENTDEKMILRNTVMTIAHKVYLDQCLTASRQGANDRKNEQKQ